MRTYDGAPWRDIAGKESQRLLERSGPSVSGWHLPGLSDRDGSPPDDKAASLLILRPPPGP